MWSGCFQQDGATPHTERVNMQAVQQVFGDCIITHDVWPLQSQDLTLLYFYLWGKLKVVYANNPNTIELKDNIRAAFWTFSMRSRCECLLRCGGMLNFAFKLMVDIFST